MALRRGPIRAGKDVKKRRVRIREQMGLNFRGPGIKGSELIAVYSSDHHKKNRLLQNFG
ncbi:MAG: hypothetical protein GTO13_22445 [Proteobacteria bacterium]|nr:hypothetical protein [Pseudomonadota bacterium]